jgi:hypothetical protein
MATLVAFAYHFETTAQNDAARYLIHCCIKGGNTMMTLYHIELLLRECDQMAKKGLNNGVYTPSMPKIKVDIVSPQTFLGAHGNPAIFVNKDTYKLLGSEYKHWDKDSTIAIKGNFLKSSPRINVIGAIIHETGHAFNVAAEIPNTEANAYIYEIEVMCKLLATQSPLLFGCTSKEVQSFFQSRLGYYKIGANRNEYLASLVEAIKLQFELKEKVSLSLTAGVTLFAKSQWRVEEAIVTSKMAPSPSP